MSHRVKRPYGVTSVVIFRVFVFGTFLPGLPDKCFLTANTSPPKERAFFATMRFITGLLLFSAIVRLYIAVCSVQVARSSETMRGPHNGTAHPVAEKSRRRLPRMVGMAY